MRLAVTFTFALTILASCSSVLRQPDLSIDNVQAVPAENTYDVTSFDVTPQIVARANSEKFARFANVGGDRVGPVRRVPVDALFSGAKLPANTRQDYRLVIGDTIEVSQAGYIANSTGVEQRETVKNIYRVNERGRVRLNEGMSVQVVGLTVEEAENALHMVLDAGAEDRHRSLVYKDFPVVAPPVYRLGVGDGIRVSRIINEPNANGDIRQSVNNTVYTVGSDGVVSILQVGDIEVLGLTVTEARERVIDAAVRNAVGAEVVVETVSFSSQRMFVFGRFGTRVVSLDDRPRTYDVLIGGLNPNLDNDRDFVVRLQRGTNEYVMSARDILSGSPSEKYYVLPEDRLTISEALPRSSVSITVQDFGARSVTFFSSSTGSGGSGNVVPIDLKGLDLRQLLVTRGVEVDRNSDSLVRVVRGDKEYKLSAQEVVITKPNRRYWLSPGDHVVVEEIAYVGDQALLVGEISAPKLLSIDQYKRTTMSQALFAGGVFGDADADFKHVYILRGKGQTFTAYHFDLSEVLNLSLAEKFELRPGDIMFVRTRPLTKYNRALALALTFIGSLDTGIERVRTFGEP